MRSFQLENLVLYYESIMLLSHDPVLQCWVFPKKTMKTTKIAQITTKKKNDGNQASKIAHIQA